MPVEATNTFHSTVTVLGHRSAGQISSAEKQGILVQLICFCHLCWLPESELS